MFVFPLLKSRILIPFPRQFLSPPSLSPFCALLFRSSIFFSSFLFVFWRKAGKKDGSETRWYLSSICHSLGFSVPHSFYMTFFFLSLLCLLASLFLLLSHSLFARLSSSICLSVSLRLFVSVSVTV